MPFTEINTSGPAPSRACEVYAELQALFADDPSEALYRAEAELPHREFIAFVQWASA